MYTWITGLGNQDIHCTLVIKKIYKIAFLEKRENVSLSLSINSNGTSSSFKDKMEDHWVQTPWMHM